MQAGKLRHRITIQKLIKAQNAIGEWVESYVDWVTCWASIEPATGSAYYQAKQTEAKVDGKIHIRYRVGVEPTMQVLYGDRVLSIISVVHPKEARKELHLMYTEALD